jgi:hypothetical protein
MKLNKKILLIFIVLFLAGTLTNVKAGNFKINLQNITTIDVVGISN